MRRRNEFGALDKKIRFDFYPNSMVGKISKSYPGDNATAAQIIKLADEYKRAAFYLQSIRKSGNRISADPFRTVAIHAIELYLNAFLLHSGFSHEEIRGLHHNLAARTHKAMTAKLSLRKRTIGHLQTMTLTREYLLARYDPAALRPSQINRLTATLNEVSEKISLRIAEGNDATSATGRGTNLPVMAHGQATPSKLSRKAF